MQWKTKATFREGSHGPLIKWTKTQDAEKKESFINSFMAEDIFQPMRWI